MAVISLKEICRIAEDHAELITDSNENLLADIYPAEQLECQPPLNLDASDDAKKFINSPIPHFYELVHRAEPVTLSILSNVYLTTPHGLMFDADRHLIAESYHNASMVEIPLREVTTILANGVFNAQPTSIIEAPALLALGPWSWIYHHWLLEILPRLWVREEFPDLADLRSFQASNQLAPG